MNSPAQSWIKSSISIRAAIVTVILLSKQAGWTQQVEMDCVKGSPFGVGRISLTLRRSDPQPLSRLVEADDRLFYVATDSRRRGLLLNRGSRVEYWFLFKGEEPLRIQWAEGEPALSLTPEENRGAALDRMMWDWWGEFQEDVRERIERDNHPPVADQYLLAMLSRRLQLPLETKRRQREKEDRPLETAELLASTERLRTTILRDAMLQPAPNLRPAADVPKPVLWMTLPEQSVDQNVEIEPLAMVTPPECFYVRFGKFSNFLWLTHLVREQGGDLGNMISARGFSQDLNDRFERQFAIRYSILADLLGDQVVADLALFGSDVYMSDGAAMAVLLQAKNSLLLDAALDRERDATMAREQPQGIRKFEVKIKGHPVEVLATSDNGVRSYLAKHKEFRLVSNSRHLVERFFEVVDGNVTPLGKLNEFQHARMRRPADNDDTIFAYFSTHFFHELVSPQYQIELRRRLRSVCDFQILELAQLAARREGRPTDETSMKENGFLPADWGQRIDGSRLVRGRDGRWLDSLRGARGTMLPIPDVAIKSVAPHELKAFAETAEFYQQKWRTMDPLMAAVKRFAVKGHKNRERLVIDAEVSPFVEKKYSRWLGLLGKPISQRITAPSNAVITGQASLRGGLVWPDVPAHQLFFGILDRRPDIADLQTDGLLDALRTIQAIPGYLGAWPRPGFLDDFPFSPTRQEDENGYSQLPFRLWRWRQGDYSVLSFNRGILEEVTPTFKEESNEGESQAWVRIHDLTETKLAPWLRQLTFQQARRVSQGNAEWFTTLSQTFGASAEQTQEIASRLVDGEVACPLNTKYQVQGDVWRSTVPGGEAPEDYISPLLRWFRGGAVMLNASRGRLVVHGEVDIQRQGSTTPAVNPATLALPILGGLPSLFGN